MILSLPEEDVEFLLNIFHVGASRKDKHGQEVHAKLLKAKEQGERDQQIAELAFSYLLSNLDDALEAVVDDDMHSMTNGLMFVQGHWNAPPEEWEVQAFLDKMVYQETT